jgi:hypothetical protein
VKSKKIIIQDKENDGWDGKRKEKEIVIKNSKITKTELFLTQNDPVLLPEIKFVESNYSDMRNNLGVYKCIFCKI